MDLARQLTALQCVERRQEVELGRLRAEVARLHREVAELRGEDGATLQARLHHDPVDRERHHAEMRKRQQATIAQRAKQRQNEMQYAAGAMVRKGELRVVDGSGA